LPPPCHGFGKKGNPAHYGDITHSELLERIGLADTRALVVTVDDRARADALMATARVARPDLLLDLTPYCVTGPGAARVGPASAGACTCATFSVMDTRL